MVRDLLPADSLLTAFGASIAIIPPWRKGGSFIREDFMKMFVTRLAATAVAVVSLTAAAHAFDPGATECIAPAAPGGGWDFTCRQVGKTLQDLGLVASTVQVTNLAGGGGGVAFAEVVNKRNDANDLIVAASSATSTRLARAPIRATPWTRCAGSPPSARTTASSRSPGTARSRRCRSS
jgi:hypothetical protein